MKYILVSLLIIIYLTYFTKAVYNVTYTGLNTLDESNYTSDRSNHPWKPYCYYVNETFTDRVMSTDKCMELIDFMFDDDLMKNKLDRLYVQSNSTNDNKLTCNPTTCIVQFIGCIEKCSQQKILECAECLGKVFVTCCDCVLSPSFCKV